MPANSGALADKLNSLNFENFDFSRNFYSSDLSVKLEKNWFTRQVVAILNLFSDKFRLEALAHNLFETCIDSEGNNLPQNMVWEQGKLVSDFQADYKFKTVWVAQLLQISTRLLEN